MTSESYDWGSDSYINCRCFFLQLTANGALVYDDNMAYRGRNGLNRGLASSSHGRYWLAVKILVPRDDY